MAEEETPKKKKTASKSPTARSLEYLRKQGFIAQVVEKYNTFSRQRVDLFNFIDVVAISDNILGVQSTSDTNVSARVHKILEEPKALSWIHAGGLIVVHGWGKKGPRGKRKLWTLREVPITEEMFNGQDRDG